MGQNILKSKFGKLGIGAVLLVIILAGMLLIGRQPKTSVPAKQEAVTMKIPRKPVPQKIEPPPPVQEEAEKLGDTLQSRVPAAEMPAEEPEVTEPESAAFDSEMPLETDEGEGGPADMVTAAERQPAADAINDPFARQEDGADAEPDVGAAFQSISKPPEDSGEIEEESDTEAPKSKVAEVVPVTPEKKEKHKPSRAASRPPADLSEADQTLVLQDVRLSENLKGKVLEIWANTQIEKNKYFILSNPPRLVIDLPGKWEEPRFQRKAMDDSLISGIRLWRHPDKLRIVSDLVSEKKAIKPRVTPNPEGVEFLLVTD